MTGDKKNKFNQESKFGLGHVEFNFALCTFVWVSIQETCPLCFSIIGWVLTLFAWQHDCQICLVTTGRLTMYLGRVFWKVTSKIRPLISDRTLWVLAFLVYFWLECFQLAFSMVQAFTSAVLFIKLQYECFRWQFTLGKEETKLWTVSHEVVGNSSLPGNRHL